LQKITIQKKNLVAKQRTLKTPWILTFCRILQEAKSVFLQTVTNCNLVTYDKDKIYNETLFQFNYKS